jgi:high-affinity Fe2+/Pb2+ permease
MNFLDSLEQIPFIAWIRESPSVLAYPSVLWLHVMGMAVVAGISGVISLRLLGVSPKTAVQPLERLYPLMWCGFWLNAVTGTALLLASASTRLLDPTFYVKMIFIFAGVAVLQLTRKKVFRSLGPDGALPESARTLAWAGLICWLGAVTAGRLLAYI